MNYVNTSKIASNVDRFEKLLSIFLLKISLDKIDRLFFQLLNLPILLSKILLFHFFNDHAVLIKQNFVQECM